MIKHFFDKHEDEKLEDMKFGMRIVKAARTAFNRQICESVEIQNNKKNHYILNSRSEYNRCALPRLTAKLGEETFDKIDKEKREEKMAEIELTRKIRNLKVKKSQDRRELSSRMEQPAEKKRKTGEESHRRVIQNQNIAEKRKDDEDKDRERILFPIFRNQPEKRIYNKKHK